MVCLATLSLGALISALLIPIMINNDWRRAKFVFFYGLIALALQQGACLIDGDFGGWLAFFLIVVATVLLVLGHLGYLDTPVKKNCPLPPIRPSASGSGPGFGPGSGSACKKPDTIPMCPDCPGVDPCPPPTCL